MLAGLKLCCSGNVRSRHSSSATPLIRRTVLFELRARKWRNAVDLRHMPEGTHCLAHRPGSLDQLAFQNGSCGCYSQRASEEEVLRTSSTGFASGSWPCRIPGKRKFPKTRATDEAPWARDGNRLCPSRFPFSCFLSAKRSAWQDLHLQPSRFEGEASAVGRHAVGAHGRICTDTVRVLSAPSLHWTTWAELVPREGFPPPTSPF